MVGGNNSDKKKTKLLWFYIMLHVRKGTVALLFGLAKSGMVG